MESRSSFTCALSLALDKLLNDTYLTLVSGIDLRRKAHACWGGEIQNLKVRN